MRATATALTLSIISTAVGAAPDYLPLKEGNEGAKVYQTDSWGLEGPEGRLDSRAYNTTNFTGENPWTGGNLELVDTRTEYERYGVNQ